MLKFVDGIINSYEQLRCITILDVPITDNEDIFFWCAPILYYQYTPNDERRTSILERLLYAHGHEGGFFCRYGHFKLISVSGNDIERL